MKIVVIIILLATIVVALGNFPAFPVISVLSIVAIAVLALIEWGLLSFYGADGEILWFVPLTALFWEALPLVMNVIFGYSGYWGWILALPIFLGLTVVVQWVRLILASILGSD